MQRAEKKKSLPETPVTKAKKSVSAKIVEPEKPLVAKKKSVVSIEKPAKKAKSEPSVKIAIPAPKAKKSVGVSPKAKQNPIVVSPKVKRIKEIVIEPVTAKKSSPKPKPIKAEAIAKKPVTIKPEAANKKAQIKPEPINKKATLKDKKTETANIKLPEKKVEIVAQPIKPKPLVKKKLKPISSAVVRGKLGKYDFEVFPLDAELKDGSAIYLISKRVTDKSGRGHHKFVCIGQTESVLGDLKKHKKDKCIKQHKANVICLLREENEKNRLKIETDLREAHTIACNHQLGV